MATKTFVELDATQTLTSKTLTAPLLSGATCGADPTAALGVATKQYVEAILAAAIPPGLMLPYGGGTPPTGFLECNGQAVSRTTYAALFAVCSTTYGAGNGSTTFNVPDKRGRTSIGAGQGTSLTNRTRGTKLGAETHALSATENAAHSHTYTAPGGLVFNSAGGAQPLVQSLAAGTVTSTSGSGAPHNNMQPSEVDLWVIKT